MSNIGRTTSAVRSFLVTLAIVIVSGASGAEMNDPLRVMSIDTYVAGARGGVFVAAGQGDMIFRSSFESGEQPAPGCLPDALDLDGDGLLDPICVIGFVPPDPVLVAPPINPTVPANVADATEFLYIGPNPIQRGVAPGTIERYRAGVVRGLVKNAEGAALAGVLVRVLD